MPPLIESKQCRSCSKVVYGRPQKNGTKRQYFPSRCPECRYTRPPESVQQLQDRFWPKVDQTDSCWVWQGSYTNQGYGTIRTNRKANLAHRLAYIWCVGPIPDGLTIDHLCRNRGCVRPDHLEPVTAAENVQRGAKSRWSPKCPHGHLRSDHEVTSRSGKKRCKTCERERSQTNRRTKVSQRTSPS
jgi:hypothetical protein